MQNVERKKVATMLRMAAAITRLDDIQNEIGKNHPGSDGEVLNAPYDNVERRMSQYFNHVQDWKRTDPIIPKVEAAGECEPLPVKSASRMKKSGPVRKSTQKQLG